jgi:protein ImuB
VILMRERFAAMTLAAPVHQIKIEANDILALAGSVASLFPESVKESGDCHRLIERLQARLGPDAVQGLSPSADYRPELSWLATQPGARTKGEEAPLRPLWLLDEPRLLREVASKPHYGNEPLMVVAGPEIIESGWWNEDIKRDYFVAQTPAHSTYWIFRERRQPCAWYLHGIFG